MGNNMSKRSPKGEIRFDIQLSEDQKDAKANILNHPVNFVMGQAGSGKTALAVQVALDLYFKRQVEKIVITRPTISSEDNGFLPGSLNEKMEPWLVPIKSNMYTVYNKPEKLNKMMEEGAVELVSLSHFRGRTFANAVCVVDEFQNLNKEQLAMCLGRLGKNTTMIFTGDPRQIDLKYKDQSAVHDMYKIFSSQYVYNTTLVSNHRHEALIEIFNLLYG
jgi:phosphate starvation-inducible PhoH-like protein